MVLEMWMISIRSGCRFNHLGLSLLWARGSYRTSWMKISHCLQISILLPSFSDVNKVSMIDSTDFIDV